MKEVKSYADNNKVRSYQQPYSFSKGNPEKTEARLLAIESSLNPTDYMQMV